jgi:ABC-type multidrug transport system fused ATPase/permease subunit
MSKTRSSSSSSSSSEAEEFELAPYEGEDVPLAKKGGKQIDEDEDDDDDEQTRNEEMGRAALYEDDQEMAIVSKYAKVNQPCPFSQHPPRHHINLEWRNISYKVVFPLPPKNLLVKLLLKLPIPDMITNLFKKKMEMPILNNVSGSVRSGELIAIMGPTGSGKTTLLNVLARRTKLNVTGDILVNGEPVQGRRLKRRMAYVLQDDIFFPNLTVRDTISYTAYLKLPKSLSWKEKREKVEEILTELGIQRCSNTIVGGGWVVRLTPPPSRLVSSRLPLPPPPPYPSSHAERGEPSAARSVVVRASRRATNRHSRWPCCCLLYT